MTKFKIGKTNIVIEKGLIDGTPVKDTEVDVTGIYLVDCYNKKPEPILNVTPQKTTLNAANISQLFTVVSDTPVVFGLDNLVAIEIENQTFDGALHIYDVRVINTLLGEGVSTISITSESGASAEFTVNVGRGF